MANPLMGLIGSYGDSDEESDDAVPRPPRMTSEQSLDVRVAPEHATFGAMDSTSATIHPAPIPHCPWSACYDEGSGFTYYWNQHTNAVTWEAPPEYLLALKLAQQQLTTAGSEVSAEEWQLYQQALAEKQNTQNKVIAKSVIPKPAKMAEKDNANNDSKRLGNSKRRAANSDDEEKIELITSYYNSDSESESETPTKIKATTPPLPKPPKLPKIPLKKQKTAAPILEYGPSLPPNQNYKVPIGPEMPSRLIEENTPPPKPTDEITAAADEETKPTKVNENEDSQDESLLLMKLKNKAKLLEKLGGEIPTELQKIIQDETACSTASPKLVENVSPKTVYTNIDDLLEEIEKKELPKVKSKAKIGVEVSHKSTDNSALNSPRSSGDRTPPIEEFKPLFPSSKAIDEMEKPSLFPSAANIQENGDTKPKCETPPPEKKPTNIYLLDSNEPIENVGRKKLRISNSVLPERKKIEVPAYTTKYSQYIEGFSSERTGLGFKEDEVADSPKNTISYGKSLTFTKGETLNEDKKDEALDDMSELVEAKLQFLNQLQPCAVTPVQEMLIQMQTLVSAFRSGALAASHWRRWCAAAAAELRAHEARAAPPGWTCSFQRAEGRYRYRRLADGLVQWEYPAVATTDMDICTTPPHVPSYHKEDTPAPPLPPPQPPASAPPPPPPAPPAPPAHPAPPPPAWARVATPPPPQWADPPPPGCDDPPPLPMELPKKEIIGDELMSFYNDIAELEKQAPPPAPPAPATPPAPPSRDLTPPPPAPERDRARSREKESKEAKINRKKSKVKISSSIGMKHKSVSSMVAKWQQVADEIHSD